MIGLMSMLVPGILAGRALGKVAPYRGRPMLPRPLATRALVVALASAALGVVLAGVALIGLGALPLSVALAAKLGFGAILAAIITPMGLRAALAQ
jgi:hypothetical protein